MVVKIRSTKRSNKVVVTVDVESSLSQTLELAIALAIASKSELHCLFIEDQDLLQVASLPFAHEVMLAGGQSRILDNQQLLRSFNAGSRYFRHSLAQQAEKSSLSWTYSKVRGRRRSMELAESAEAEFLIIGQQTGRYSQVLKPNRILLINHDNPRLYQALDVVLANLPDRPVDLILVAPVEPIPRNSLQQLTNKLEANPHSSLMQINPDALVTTLVRKSQPVDYVIVSRRDPELLQQIMQNSSCPMIVVS